MLYCPYYPCGAASTQPIVVMSLHAHLSPEAIARLEAQKRRSTISSLVIAALAVMLIGMVLSLFLLPAAPPSRAEFIGYIQPREKPQPADPVERPELVTRPTPAPPMRPQSRMLRSLAPADVSVPDSMITEPDLTTGPGASPDFGSSSGFDPDGKRFHPLPPGDRMSKRCSPRDRREQLQKYGGSMEGEQAVTRALDWLQRTQNADGSWGTRYQSAMTGFAILAYLGRCEHPYSAKYGDTVSRGLTYLIDLGMKQDGRLSVMPAASIQWVYEHAIATYALAEAQIFCKQLKKPFPQLEGVIRKAGEIILDGQADSGGWNYRYANSPHQGDNSVGFWQMQALKACKHTGLWADARFKRPMRQATAFLERVQGATGAIGYRTDPSRSPHLTGGGVLCLQIWGEGDSRAAKNGIEWVRGHSSFRWGGASANLYYHYYHAQALMNAGGEDWEWYNAMFRDPLIAAQNEDGSWSQKMQHGPINDHMATCLAALMLEVYYRFLPGTHH